MTVSNTNNINSVDEVDSVKVTVISFSYWTALGRMIYEFDGICCVAIRTMIERKKKTVEGRLVRHTTTDGYADFGSQAYAPLTRIGIFVDRNSEQYVVKNKYLANYAGLSLLC